MSKNILGNAFSLQMLALEEATTLNVVPVGVDEVKSADFVSVVGHADTANVIGSILGREVEMNRVSVSLEPGDVLYVAQLTGGRLPEGSTTLPDGFQLKFVRVTFE
ncbi:MAG: DUF1874 domain-containing protein [Pseudobutyrivibrio sp.]|nr:DUF1874 domain-containing protein [Pseudobutyrivibrio sp.]